MKKLIFPFLALLCYANVGAQSAQKLTATKANEYGLIYTLPVTALDITVEAETIEKIPGEFYKYSKKYLNIDNPITAPEKNIYLKKVTVATHGVANPDERYVITLKSTQSPFIMVSPDNILLSVNTEKTAQLPADQPAGGNERKSRPVPVKNAAQQVITEDMIMSHSSAKKAELAAEQIYEIRQTRNELLTGQADQMPPDGAALKLIMDNLEAREQALLEMFIGTEVHSSESKTITIVPDGDMSNKVICRLSATKGIVDAQDLSGAPVFITINNIVEGELPVNEKGEEIPFPKGGIAYCIPGKADVSIAYDGKTYFNKNMDFGQFGIVFGMAPANFTDKKAPVYLILDPTTGAPLEVGPAL